LFSSLGRIDEASMIELALALQKKQPEQKLTALRRCVNSGLNSPTLQNEAGFVQEKINLLERQVFIEVRFHLQFINLRTFLVGRH
jgi:hypothetical protein